MTRGTLDQLLANTDRKADLVLITDLTTGAADIISPVAGAGHAPEMVDAARVALDSDRCETIEHQGRSLFLQPLNPPPRMIIVGAVHVAQPLAAMAATAAWEVAIVDPRQAWATAERFPGVSLYTEWPDDGVAALAPDRRTAVVTLTHDPKLDDPALALALRSPAFYVGALGSRKTHAARLQRLSALGFTNEDLARIHAPIGLDIGAQSPAEVAIAILAQATARLRARTAELKTPRREAQDVP